MSDILDDLEEAGAETGADKLDVVVALANTQIEREGEVDRLNAQLKIAKEKLNDIQLFKLPEAMRDAGIEDLTLESGKKVKLTEKMTISVPAYRKSEVIAKVREMGYPGIISNVVSIDIEKGKDNVAGELMAQAEEHGCQAVRTEKVNSATLKTLLAERMKDGHNDDLTFFGAFVATKTTVK